MVSITSSARHTDQGGRVWTATAVARLRVIRSTWERVTTGQEQIDVLIRFSAGSEERFARAHGTHWRSPGRLRRLFRSARAIDPDRPEGEATVSAA
jgi:hypothetical protein